MNVETDESLRRFDTMADDIIKALDRLTAAVERLGAKQKAPEPEPAQVSTEVFRCDACAHVETCPYLIGSPTCISRRVKKAVNPSRTCGECAMWPRHRPQNNIVCNAADFFGFDHPCTQPAIFQPREVTS